VPLLATAGRLLPHPFTPHLPAQDLRTAAALLSVAVVVTPPIAVPRPHLLFHGAIVSAVPKRSREVPLLTADQQRRRTLFWVQLLSCCSRSLSGPMLPDFYSVLCPAGCQVCGKESTWALVRCLTMAQRVIYNVTGHSGFIELERRRSPRLAPDFYIRDEREPAESSFMVMLGRHCGCDFAEAVWRKSVASRAPSSF